MMNEVIFKLAEEALTINRTFAEGIHAKQAMKPEGFMPPDKRVKIIKILEEICKLAQEDFKPA